MSVQEEFQDWMVKEEKNGQGTANNYAWAIDKISQNYSENTREHIDIYKITDLLKLKHIAKEYCFSGKYSDFGNFHHGLYRASINKYLKFIEAKENSGIIKKSGIEINPKETININGIDIPLFKSNDETIQKFVQKILRLMIKNNLISNNEIINMLNKDYCEKTFGINYPIIQVDENKLKDDKGHSRYWKNEIAEIHGKTYYACSQWWKQKEVIYKKKLSEWIKKVARIINGETTDTDWKKPQNDGEKYKNILSNDKKQKLTSNNKHEILNKAFDFILPVLPRFIGSTLEKNDKNTWWQKYVINNLPSNTIWDLPKNGTYDECINKLDISLCLKIIIQNWQNIFKYIIKNIKLSWVHELIEIRNDVSHWSIEKSNNYYFEHISHTLSVMKLFMGSIDTNIADQISELKKEFESKFED